MQKLKSKWKKVLGPLGAALGGALVLGPLVMGLELDGVEARFYDAFATIGFLPAPTKDIVLVTLDQSDGDTAGLPLPLSLSEHVDFIKQARRLKPSALGYLVDLAAVEQVDPEALTKNSKNFISEVRGLEAQGTRVLFGTSYDVNGEVLPPKSLEVLPRAVAVLHQDGNVFAGDQVTRRTLVSLYGHPTFHAVLAGHHQKFREKFRAEFRGQFPAPEVEGAFVFFKYFRGGQSMPYLNYQLSELKTLADGAWAGKTVLVGTLNRENPSDLAKTPFFRSTPTTPKLAVHAQILDALRSGRTLSLISRARHVILTVTALAVVLAWVWAYSPLSSAGLALGLGGGMTLLAWLSFQGFGLWIPVGQTLIAIAAGYYLVVPFRLLREYRSRWDFQRKAQVLTQVEELKSNFMSLVTHDLKTPVARIQGLAEVLLSRLSVTMSPEDCEALKKILVATDDLNRFITSILELARVESRQLTLKLESKDINKLIEKSHAELGEAARAKEINVELQLEPLFPIKVDPGLITRVINNLLDNAIKYSPKGSRIVLSSKEAGDFVEVRVQDESLGLTEDEKTALFTKFYRAKNSLTQVTPGSGLGLYLSRYFVQAHRGELDVESEPGKGSTFVMRIPLGGKSHV